MVGVVTPGAAPAILRHVGASESRVVVSHEGPGEPIVLRVYGPEGEVAVPLAPVRALELARELTEPAVSVIKTSQWGSGWPG